jgi:hypothetical protein
VLLLSALARHFARFRLEDGRVRDTMNVFLTKVLDSMMQNHSDGMRFWTLVMLNQAPRMRFRDEPVSGYSRASHLRVQFMSQNPHSIDPCDYAGRFIVA